MTLADFFNRVYVLNLPYRTDRRRAMARELARAGMPLTPGRVEIVPGVRPAQADNFPDVGMLGCFLGHLGAMKKAREECTESVLILEDDLAFSPDLAAATPNFVERLSTEPWDIVYFGHILDVPEPATGPALVRAPGPVMLTHFVGYHRRVLDRLIAFLELVRSRPGGHPEGGPMQIDGAIGTFWMRHTDVVTLVAAPSQGWQRSSRSDNLHVKWFDRIPVVRGMVEAARGVKRWFDPRRRR